MSLPLEDALRQCDRHAQRMDMAMQRIPFPLDGHELAQDNEALITVIDQFVFRFIKFQDTLGEHVLRQFCLRVLRNTLTHEYPEQVTWQAATLNRAHGMGLQLMDWLTRLKLEFERRKPA